MSRTQHKPAGPSQRMLRVGELVRHALADLFQRGEVEDPELDNRTITVPEVRMSADLRLATAFVVPLGGEGAEGAAAALNRHRRFIRGRIAPVLGLKFAPEVRFVPDKSFDEAARIEALLRSERVQRDLARKDDSEPGA